MLMRLIHLSTAIVIAAALGACSSRPATPASAERLPAGTAKVTINDRALPQTHSVKCLPLGSLTTIATGNPAAGITVFVSSKNALRARSVTITDVGGFTGSYLEGLAGKADVTLNDQTYMIRGSADGFDADNPSQRATGRFTIQVAC